MPLIPHPNVEILLRFAEGTSRRVETREVVRHLLRGCRVCSVLVAGRLGDSSERNAAGRRDFPGGMR